MMLPILISVSVTPLSYFFCATAGAEAAARMGAEMASVVAKSFSARFIESPPAGLAQVTCRRFPRFVFFDVARRIAAPRNARKRQLPSFTGYLQGRFVARRKRVRCRN